MSETKRVVVAGAGLMGHGIGLDFAISGSIVTLYDVAEDSLRRSRERIQRELNELVAWRYLSPDEVQPILDRMATTTVIEDATRDADIVIEAVFEDLEVKRGLFSQLDAVCPERTILASNSSALMPSMLASATERPDKVLVMHYYNPPYLIPLVEVVGSRLTSEETIQAAYRLLMAAGKTPVIMKGEAPGFIANRLQAALYREAHYIVERGWATAEDIDIAVTNSIGRRLALAGPFAILDAAGLDVGSRAGGYLYRELCNTAEGFGWVAEKVARGELGMKTGRGFYEWTPESAEAWRQRMAESLCRSLRPRHGASLAE